MANIHILGFRASANIVIILSPESINDLPLDARYRWHDAQMEAKKISSMGTDVYFVNGNKPDRITAAARGGKFPCTKFGGKKR